MRKYGNKITHDKNNKKDSRSFIYHEFGENSQLKRTGKACNKLTLAIGEFKGTKSLDSLEYLSEKIADLEFLTEQIKATYNLEARVSERKYYLEKQLKKEIIERKNLKTQLEDNKLEEILEGV